MKLNSYGKNVHFIDVGDVVLLRRRDIEKEGKHYTFYTVPIKKWYMGKQMVFMKEVKFPKEIGDIKDGTKIRILSMFEDVHLYKNIPVWCYMIDQYEIVEEPDLNSQLAILNYQQEMEENKMVFSNIMI